MKIIAATMGALASILFSLSAAHSEPFVYGFRADLLEYRIGEDADVAAWETFLSAGTDDLKGVWRSDGEYDTTESAFEELENQFRLQTPITEFFDAVAGVRFDTPKGPNRTYGVIGVHGLAPQWFEVDLDFFISGDPIFRLEAEYEGLITNRIILSPRLEVDLPLTNDEEIGAGAWGPKMEVGLRLSYDLIDRAFAPYIGVHYERVFGRSANFAEAEGEDKDGVFFVVGARLLF
ncbi:MAG: copper resistance protein B [Pseudomonadota bacterium]